MSLRFGTDGVRGVAGTELTAELVLALGRAAARVLGADGVPFVVGRDTRRSGPMLQAAFSAGVAAEGRDVVDLGVLPTPGVADAALETEAPAAVISASHNPFRDNGVKLLAAGGRKLTDREETAVEAALVGEGSAVAGLAVGTVRVEEEARDRYCAKVVGALEGRRLSGLRVALDCANGAAWQTAPAILAAAGADVVELLGVEPDGININDRCGSTDPAGLAAAVRGHQAHAGLALDGDGDRVIAVDDRGEVVDGDRLLALFAVDLHTRGRLAGPGVAVTIMTNLGFHHAMAAAGIETVSTPVGDRHILEALTARDWSLGGEQSGHIIFRDLFPSVAPTGDGMLTGLLMLDLLSRRGAPLSELAAAAMTRMPQVLVNLRVSDHRSLEEAVDIWDEVRAVEHDLGSDGRVVIRSSGTEPVVRVMVEAPSEDLARRSAERLSLAVVAALGRADG